LNEGTLFVVATPIGNLNDLSPRAREVLTTADLVAAEDTRVTGRLLSHFGIRNRQIALHEHNEEAVAEKLIQKLKDGESVALVSDAGTPLISDPGFLLLRLAHEAGITVSPVPGSSAVIAALSASGLPTDRFVFEGFLPAKNTARKKRLLALTGETRTLVFFESVHRIADTIGDMAESFGADRPAFIGRELTKMHEQCIAADLAGLASKLSAGEITAKGEFVVVVAGAADDKGDRTDLDADFLLAELTRALPGKQAVEIAARVTGRHRNELYQKMLDIKAEKN
jgi:16S rRNA (cytidine1402-2'-O)-methyltransferase